MRSTFSRSRLDAKVLLQRFMSSNGAIEGNFIHPCEIGGRQSLVHARDLPQRDPAFYQQLVQYAADHQYVLVADRRSADSPDSGGRRKSWLLVMTLSMGMQGAMAADRPGQNGEASHSSSLALFEPAAMEQLIDPEDVLPALNDQGQLQYHFADTAESQHLAAILLDHLVFDDDAPAYLKDDIAQIAAYFSQYPQIVAMLEQLADKPWKLQYQPNTFATQVRGSALRVHGVTIHFDSRAAAQLKTHSACATNSNACIASPADALLHELLHASSALLQTKQFIAQGGLNSVLYPYAHEHDVIQQERALYRAMSQQDGVPRPQRNHHAGRLVASSCTVCVQ